MNKYHAVVCSSLLLLWGVCAPPLRAQQADATAAEKTSVTDIVRETQKTVGGKGMVGLVWWIPAEYWERAAEEQGQSLEAANSTFAPLHDYTMVVVAVGKLGIGNINWYPEDDIRSSTTLRDATGTAYKPLTQISPDALGVASFLKPMFANMLGTMGQNLQILFFPAKSEKGTPLANPVREGRFSVIIANLMGQKETIYEWRLPLTSLSPPKYCPVGKERVEANWKFCPWHGNRLDDVAPADSKKSEKPQ